MKPLRQTTSPQGGGLHFMVAAAFFFSLMSLMVKLAGRRLPVTEIVFARSIVMLLISYFMLKHAGVPLIGNNRSILFLRALAGFAALLGFFFAVTRLPLADVTVIHFTNPVFTALLASLFLHESITRKEIAGLLLCLVGVVCVAQPSFMFGEGARNLDLFAVSIALVASVLSSVAYTSVRKLRESDHHIVIVFYFALVSTVVSIPLMAGRAILPVGWEWLLLIGVGFVTQTAQIFLTRGLHRERAGRAMSVSYVQVVFAATWGLVFFDELPNLLSVGGAVMIFIGTLVVARKA